MPPLLALVLLACGPKHRGDAPPPDTARDTADSARDTSPADTGDAGGPVPYGEDDRARLLDASLWGAPAGFDAWVARFGRATADTCPALEPRENEAALVGGCVEGDRTWTGEVTLSADGARLAFAAMAHDDGTTRVQRDGAQVLAGGVLTTDLAIASTGGEPYALAWTGWTQELAGWSAWWSNQAVAWRASGAIELAGVDTFAGDLAVDHGGACSREPDAGSAVLTGARTTLTLTFDGATACDGSIAWTAAGESGTLAWPW